MQAEAMARDELDRSVLKSLAPFARLSETDLLPSSYWRRARSFPAGTLVFGQGDPCGAVLRAAAWATAGHAGNAPADEQVVACGWTGGAAWKQGPFSRHFPIDETREL